MATKKKDNTDTQLAQHTELSGELASIQREIDDAKAKLDKYNGEVSGLLKFIEVQKGNLDDREIKLYDLRKLENEIVAKTSLVESLDRKIDSRNFELTRKNQEFERLSVQCANDLSAKEAEKKSVEKMIEILRAEIVSLKTKISDLKDEEGKIALSINESHQDINSLRNDIVALENRRVDSERNLQKVATEAERIRREADEYVAQKKLEAEKITLKLDERDGLISDRESWLKDKEEYLERLKREVERHYGKKINVIIKN